jgi:hypothetical protein
MKNLNYLKMLKKIDDLVETDFCFDMECHQLPNAQKFSQKEAMQMSKIISSIYSIAHCIHCQSCQIKYLTPQ